MRLRNNNSPCAFETLPARGTDAATLPFFSASAIILKLDASSRPAVMLARCKSLRAPVAAGRDTIRFGTSSAPSSSSGEDAVGSGAAWLSSEFGLGIWSCVGGIGASGTWLSKVPNVENESASSKDRPCQRGFCCGATFCESFCKRSSSLKSRKDEDEGRKLRFSAATRRKERALESGRSGTVLTLGKRTERR